MCYELEELYRQRAEEQRKALERERRKEQQQPAKPADKPKEQPEPVPV